MNLPRRLLLIPAIAAAISLVSVPALASDTAPSRIVQPAARSAGAGHDGLLEFLLQPVGDPVQFEGKRVAIVASNGASAFELETTRDYFVRRGAHVDVLAPRPAESATIMGLAGFMPPRESLTALDYAGQQRVIAVTWYLDQVGPQAYDAVYVPNNLQGIEQLATNPQTLRFLVAAQGAQRAVFVSGNARAIVYGLEVPDTTAHQWRVYAGQNAFDIPELIGALADVLIATPDRGIN
jgi:hypothetical protein